MADPDDLGALAFPVFVNGNPIGYIKEATAASYVSRVRVARRNRECSFELSVCLQRYGVFANIDAGRLMRPVFVARRLQSGCPSTSFDELMNLGAIEYLDKREEENFACVAVNPEMYGSESFEVYAH